MRLAIATSTGPGDWGLPLDNKTLSTFELELTLQAEQANQRAALGR